MKPVYSAGNGRRHFRRPLKWEEVKGVGSIRSGNTRASEQVGAVYGQ